MLSRHAPVVYRPCMLPRYSYEQALRTLQEPARPRRLPIARAACSHSPASCTHTANRTTWSPSSLSHASHNSASACLRAPPRVCAPSCSVRRFLLTLARPHRTRPSAARLAHTCYPTHEVALVLSKPHFPWTRLCMLARRLLLALASPPRTHPPTSHKHAAQRTTRSSSSLSRTSHGSGTASACSCARRLLLTRLHSPTRLVAFACSHLPPPPSVRLARRTTQCSETLVSHAPQTVSMFRSSCAPSASGKTRATKRV